MQIFYDIDANNNFVNRSNEDFFIEKKEKLKNETKINIASFQTCFRSELCKNLTSTRGTKDPSARFFSGLNFLLVFARW